jgi:uroporphyrinogen-III synthase
MDAPLVGYRIALFESRYAAEFGNLVAKQGAETLIAPTIVEAELTLGPELEAFAAALRGGQIDVYCVLTGVGQRKLVELVAPILPRDELRALLGSVLVAARGPKAVGGLKELPLHPQVVAPAPHTWEDLMRALTAHTDLSGKRVALQQYGVPHERMTRALADRGAEVLQVPVYRWQIPEDVAPIARVIEALCEGSVDGILFTAGPQAGVMLEVAARIGREADLRAALQRVVVGSVGPSCTEALRNLEIAPDFEPEHGKMGHLARDAGRNLPALRAQKQALAAG